MKKYFAFLIIFFSLIGIFDTGYLTIEHFSNRVPLCTGSVLIDCGQVLKSQYATVYGIPLAFLGFVYYLTIFGVTAIGIFKRDRLVLGLISALSAGGLIFSFYLLYLQLFVIGSICLYCTLSGITTMLIFFASFLGLSEERKYLTVYVHRLFYVQILRRGLFLFDSEFVHNLLTSVGEVLGWIPLAGTIANLLVVPNDRRLRQEVAGIKFKNPIGLAAGFDYEAKLTATTAMLGFGFQSVGTITNMAYGGNTKPRLGRLPNSKSLLVNKGFMNKGMATVVHKLTGVKFPIPVGMSIGKTNVLTLKTQQEGVDDIVEAFKTAEGGKINISYYELNISCPNLAGKISFYPPKNLEELLLAVDKLKLSKPVFIKMPIDKSNKETLGLLSVIVQHKITGVIFGNLQKDRKHPSLDPVEVAKYPVGYFSGKPTFDRSNELISLTYKNYRDKLVIIGCGGVFNGRDAYEKISRGASLVQMITGLIFEGPLTPALINQELVDLLEQGGFKSIAELRGTAQS